MSPNQAIFNTFIIISYLLVFIEKYNPGSIVYFVLFCFVFFLVKTMPKFLIRLGKIESQFGIPLIGTLSQLCIDNKILSYNSFQHYPKLIDLVLKVNGIWEVVPPTLIVEKFQKKLQMQSILFFASIIKNFQNIFRTIITYGGLSRHHYWRGGIHEIHDFRGSLRISQRVFYISS